MLKLILVALLVGCAFPVAAQEMATRFGFGAGAVINPSNADVSTDDLGIDLRGRMSQPLTGSLSFAVGVGAFLFSHENQTEVVINPQAMFIATMDGDKRFPYFVFGGGALLPNEEERDAQLTIHAGYGWAWPFGARTSFFVEANPMVAFREEGIAVMVPVRGGVIF